MGRGANIKNKGVTESRVTLGDRMKDYERETKMFLPKKSYTIVRLDGRSFHTWTKGLKRPYDERMMRAMATSTERLCEEISGVVFAYTQSDEISLLLSDNRKAESQAFFGGNIQKITSVAASIVTGHFNKHFPDRPLAVFDARAFTLPSKEEVSNYFRWRQIDAEKNAISMIAEDTYPSRELHGKKTRERVKMLEKAGISLDDVPKDFLHGTK